MFPVILEAVVLIERCDSGKFERWELLVKLAVQEVHSLPVSSSVPGGGFNGVFDAAIQNTEQRRMLGHEGGVADTGEALVFAEAATGAVRQGDGDFDVNSASHGVGVEEVVASLVLELVHLLNPVINFDFILHSHLCLIDVSYYMDKKGN